MSGGNHPHINVDRLCATQALELLIALSSVQEEARDSRFMDLGTHREHEHRDTM